MDELGGQLQVIEREIAVREALRRRLLAERVDEIAADGACAVPESTIREIEHEPVRIACDATPGQLRRAARRIVEPHLVRPLEQRHEAAREERAVWLNDLGDGMCDVTGRVPTVLGETILDRLTSAARPCGAASGRASRSRSPGPRCSTATPATGPR